MRRPRVIATDAVGRDARELGVVAVGSHGLDTQHRALRHVVDEVARTANSEKLGFKIF